MSCPIRPSNFDRVASCPLSIILPNVPKREREFTNYGVRMHQALEDLLNTVNVFKVDIDTLKWLVDGEYHPTILACVQYIQINLGHLRNPTILVEHKVSLDFLIPNMSGTADIVIYDADGFELHILDLKSGSGHKVDVYKNKQLMLYAFGIAQNLDIEYQQVNIHVLQPSMQNLASYEMTIDDTRELITETKNILMGIVTNKLNNFAGEHCRFCEKNLSCPLIHHICKSVIEEAYNNRTLSINTLEHFVSYKSLIIKFLQEAEEELLDKTFNGESLNKLEVVKRRYPRKWRDGSIDVLKGFDNSNKLFKMTPKSLMELKKYLSVEILDSLLESPNYYHSLQLKKGVLLSKS